MEVTLIQIGVYFIIIVLKAVCDGISVHNAVISLLIAIALKLKIQRKYS